MEKTGSRVMIVVHAHDSPMPAIDHYFRHIHRPGNHITVLHVDTSTQRSRSASPAMYRGEDRENLERMLKMPKRLNQYESDYMQTLICKKVDFKVRCASGADARSAICQAAHEENCHLLITMDDRPRGALRRLVTMPTVDYVIKNAGIPVTVVPQPMALLRVP